MTPMRSFTENTDGIRPTRRKPYPLCWKKPRNLLGNVNCRFALPAPVRSIWESVGYFLCPGGRCRRYSPEKCAPQTDVAIELGGEDAKIIYFTGGLEERMNGVCAGGTGSFIDQMASLLQTDAAGLNREAEQYKQIYPIAARCGVFAKTDIQPLINEGATKADLAASIFQAVVNQTISGLACGKPIRGCVAFLGGPLHFLPELKKAFVRTLGLTAETTVDPDHSHLFAAMGAAMESTEKTLSQSTP